jgi:hypothetical protein
VIQGGGSTSVFYPLQYTFIHIEVWEKASH